MKEYFLKENLIYYRKNDFSGDKKTLVFVHGVSGSCSAWWPYEKIFENKYNILTYDIRGHGLSKKYPNYGDYEITNFVNDFNDLLTHLNISNFILISSSFGTVIAREYIKKYRENVIALIFTSVEDYEDDAFLLKVSRPTLKLINKILSYLPFNSSPRGHVDYSKIKCSDLSIERNFADMRNTGLRAQLYTLRHSFLSGREYNLEKINVPTLVIHGEKDSFVPIKNAIAFSQKIKNSKFIKISNFDHDIHHNAIKEMSEAIEEFVEELE